MHKITCAMLLWSLTTGLAITDTVRRISDKALTSPAGGKLIAGYYESVLEWSNVLAKRIRPVPGKPGCSYCGEGGYEENDVCPIVYAALVNAFLFSAQPPAGVSPPSAERLALMKQDAVGALRYLTQAHKTGAGACVNKHQWGNQWQSAMWARSVGLAGWILWPALDANLKLAVARLVEFEADSFLELQPKRTECNDPGAEANAWNAPIHSLACNMMPAHARAGRWSETAKLWMYNSLSVTAAVQDKTAGDDGKPIREWVRTAHARMLHGRHGTSKTVGVGGREARIVELDTDWLNIYVRVSYVVRRLPGRVNLMCYHDPTKGTGRVPQLQEWISLIGERDSSQ